MTPVPFLVSWDKCATLREEEEVTGEKNKNRQVKTKFQTSGRCCKRLLTEMPKSQRHFQRNSCWKLPWPCLCDAPAAAQLPEPLPASGSAARRRWARGQVIDPSSSRGEGGAASSLSLRRHVLWSSSRTSREGNPSTGTMESPHHGLSMCVCPVAQSCLTLRPHGLQPTRLLCPWDSPRTLEGVATPFSRASS